MVSGSRVHNLGFKVYRSGFRVWGEVTVDVDSLASMSALDALNSCSVSASSPTSTIRSSRTSTDTCFAPM